MHNDNGNAPLYCDPEYVQGQIQALQALVLALAGTADAPRFRTQALQHLETLRTALLAQPVAESRLIAVDHTQAWLRSATAAD